MSGLKVVHCIMIPDDDVDYVREAIEAALEESREVMSRHESEEPPESEAQSTSDAAEEFLRLVETQKQRVEALERAYEQLRR